VEPADLISEPPPTRSVENEVRAEGPTDAARRIPQSDRPALDDFLVLERCPSELVAVRSQTKCLMAEPEKSINAYSISGRRNRSGAPTLGEHLAAAAVPPDTAPRAGHDGGRSERGGLWRMNSERRVEQTRYCRRRGATGTLP